MKTKFNLFRRGAVFYMEDTATGKQTSLRTKDETEAKNLLEARNAAQRQPTLNLHLARAYLTASDPAFIERTWQTVMEQLQSRGKDSSRERYASVFKSPSFNGLRNKKLLETTADDFFAVFKENKVAITYFLKRLHNFALGLGWIAIPIVAPYLWPKYEPKDRRGITQDEHQSVLEQEKNAEWKLYLELLWETGAAQSDAVSMTAEDVDWTSRTITYFRMKTGSKAQFTISRKLEKVLQQLPTTGVLFPGLSTFTANDRASRFRRRCERAGVSGVTLHSYRYAWAERAKVAGMPERFAQAALGHNSKAIHRAYAMRGLGRRLAPASACDFAASVTHASGLCLRLKIADCRRGGCLTPPIPAVSSPLHCRAANDPHRWLALSFRCIPTLESSETGRKNRPCHASCRSHEARQLHPLRGNGFGECRAKRLSVDLSANAVRIYEK